MEEGLLMPVEDFGPSLSSADFGPSLSLIVFGRLGEVLKAVGLPNDFFTGFSKDLLAGFSYGLGVNLFPGFFKLDFSLCIAENLSLSERVGPIKDIFLRDVRLGYFRSTLLNEAKFPKRDRVNSSKTANSSITSSST